MPWIQNKLHYTAPDPASKLMCETHWTGQLEAGYLALLLGNVVVLPQVGSQVVLPVGEQLRQLITFGTRIKSGL